MKISALRFLLVTLVASVLSLNAWAQSTAGRIIAVKDTGTVVKSAAPAPTVPPADGSMPAGGVAIKDNDFLTENDVISTGKDSSVVLVMMNGSTVNLGPSSVLAIDQFQVDYPETCRDWRLCRARADYAHV